MKNTMKLNGKQIDVETCRGLRKIFGLMFRSKDTDALLFEFKKPTKLAIHSLFCPKFLAVWLLDDKIIDCRIIESNKLNIKPRNRFTKLVEIPFNSKYKQILKSCSSVGNKNI
jgi:uncharacterized membrane protein (UPF0127 family)